MRAVHETLSVQHKNPRLPCIAPHGTRIFAPTADQRFLAGESTDFLRTHFPMQLQSHRAAEATTVTEQELLTRLLEPGSTVIGNRVIILYGAAGSGKSELLRWLHTQITLQDIARAEVMTRISRTELDVFHIVQRLQHHYKIQPFQPVEQQRWEECRQKPRTLAKILVLTALEQLLSSDDQINALYYQLIDIVQTNLEHCFAAMSKPAEDVGAFIELFSREDLAEILRNSAIPISLEYESLRFYLLKAFRDQLLEGVDLPRILKQIAQQVQQELRQRPILLIDDLVQSINLFATDLLDYFITLEEGCWDIIVGITPSSLEATLRGKELLERISFLDTIDDRIQKFWLSDEYGLSSSFLNEINCTEYARLYLNEYKRQNQQPCNAFCPAFSRCSYLESGVSSNLLSPFNEEVLIRLFRSLPPGKGKVRYFTLYLRDILERVSQGEELLTILPQYVKSEQAVYYSHKQLAQIYELYGPLVNTETTEEAQNVLSAYRFFDLQPDLISTEQPVIVSLYKNQVSAPAQQSDTGTIATIDPGKEAIKVWLEGNSVNKQQLRNLRRGVVKAIKDGYLLDTMTRLHIAQPSRILRWAQTRLDTVPPVKLESIDDFEGLTVQRTIGSLAYTLHDFADAAGWAEQELRIQLLNHPSFPALLFQGIAYRRATREKLEKQLGIKVEELAFSLFIVATYLNKYPAELPLLIQQKISSKPIYPSRYPGRIEAERPRLPSSFIGMIRRLFDDCFKLRENVYDGLFLETMAEAIQCERAFMLLQGIDHRSISADFRLNEELLSNLLAAVQNEIAKLEQLKTNPKARSVLVSVCQTGLLTDDASQQLAALIDLTGDIENAIDDFLEHCHSLELHKALNLAYLVDLAQYEQSLALLRPILTALEADTEQEEYSEAPLHFARNFTREEVTVLVNFIQEDFRISMSQLEAKFLIKVAHHLPDLYNRLELSFQRG